MHLSVLSTLAALAALAISAPTPADDTARCAVGPIIRDGGFESGKTPPTSGGNSWTVVGFSGSSTYSLISPGSTLPNGGKYAFEAVVRPGPFSEGGETLTQTLNTCPGKNYSIVADYRFSAAVDNKCSVKIQYPFKDGVGSVTTGSAIGPAGVWSTTGSFFQAVSSASKLDIVFSCTGGASDNIDVDRVQVKLFNGNAF